MKTAVITGSSKGIGKAAAEAFAKNGYNTVICYNNSKESAKELECALIAEGRSAVAIKADVSSKDDIKRLFEEVYSLYGRIDVLVNNAGVSSFGLLSDVSDDEFDAINNVNYKGAFFSCREVIPYMLRHHSGSIVNVSSVWGITGASCESIYSASKAAVISLTKSLAKELGPSGIRVNCVAPGVIDTDMNAHLGAETMADLSDQTPLCRIGEPKEVAEAILFLASDKASFITGQTLTVDGGFIL